MLACLLSRLDAQPQCLRPILAAICWAGCTWKFGLAPFSVQLCLNVWRPGCLVCRTTLEQPGISLLLIEVRSILSGLKAECLVDRPVTLAHAGHMLERMGLCDIFCHNTTPFCNNWCPMQATLHRMSSQKKTLKKQTMCNSCWLDCLQKQLARALKNAQASVFVAPSASSLASLLPSLQLQREQK